MRTTTNAVLAGSAIALSPLMANQAIAQEATPNWLKIYVGGHIGYDWSDFDIDDPAASGFFNGEWNDLFTGTPLSDLEFVDVNPIFSSSDGDSLIGGILGGWNFFQNGNFVFGIEGDLSWTGADAKNIGRNNDTEIETGAIGIIDETREVSAEVDWKATIRARGGLLLNPNLLIFITGGIAFADVDAKQTNTRTAQLLEAANFIPTGVTLETNTVTSSGSDDEVHVGFVIGGGADLRVATGIVARAEILYMDFGSETYDFGEAGSTKIELEEVVGRIAITFDLN